MAKNSEVQKSEDLLREYSSARSKWARQAIEDNEFRNGIQWKKEQVDTLRSRAQEPLVVNVIHPAVEQAKAMLTANAPRFQSTGREDSDVKTGRIFSDIMAWIWDYSDGNLELKRVIDDYYVKGMGCMMVYYDPNDDFGKGEIRLQAVDPINVYIDPNSQSPYVDDSSHILVSKIHAETQLKSQYPQYEEIISQAVETTIAPSDTASRHGLEDQVITQTDLAGFRTSSKDERYLEVIERYTKIKVPYTRTYDPNSNTEKILDDDDLEKYKSQPAFIVTIQGKEQVVTSPEDVGQQMALYEEYGEVFHQMMSPMTGEPYLMSGEAHEGSIPDSEVRLRPITIGDLIEEGAIVANAISINRIYQIVTVGGKMLFEAMIPISYFPIITFMNRHNRNPYPLSDVRLVKGLQEYINKIRSLIVAHASSSTNQKLLVPRGAVNKAILEEEWSRAGTAVIEFDPELGQPIIASPVPLPNELYKNESDARADIERILGLYAMMQGDPTAVPQTYKGTIAIDEYGQRRIKSKRDDIEGGLNMVAKVVVELIQATYTSQKVLRLLQPNTKEKNLSINVPIYNEVSGDFLGKLNDVTVGRYDVIVVSGSTLPSNRWARFEYYLSLYEKGLIDQIEVLKQTDVADIEGVLERASQMSKMQQQIEGLNEKVKELDGDLQTSQRELSHARQRVELEKFKSDLDKTSSKAEATETVFKARAGDEVKKLRETVAEQEATHRKIIPLEE